MSNVVTMVRGKYIPTTTLLEYSRELDVFFVEMHDTYWVFAGRYPEKLKEGMRVCFRFSGDGGTAWGYGTDALWLGMFQPPIDEEA